MSAGALAREMGATGVLGGGRIGAAVDVLTDMYGDSEFTNFLTLAGPMVPSGSRLLIGDMVDRGFLDAIVTTGANLTHDVIEALGLRHYRGSFNVDDRKLLRQGYSRIADIFVQEKAFGKLDRRIRKLLKKIPVEQRKNMAYSDLLGRIGSQLADKDSILRKAAHSKVRVFSPGLLDSILGLSIWSFSQTETLQLNPMADVTRMVEMSMTSRKLGVLIIGGGLPKHNTLLATVLREGVDAAVQITADRPEPGGLSGAPLAESISWRKIRKGGRFVDVYGDATVCLPLIMAAVLEKVKRRDRRVRE
ncbi:MAG TPA: deoxyhypusine synthase family protein [Candidatus Bathyarchaeia archaeon]